MSRPRQSGIPTPGKPGSRATPSRSRASSSAGRHTNPTLDVDFVSRAFADALNANDPSAHRNNKANAPDASLGTLSPSSALPSGRQSVAGRPSSASSQVSIGSVVQRPRTPTALRTPGRPSDANGRCPSRTGRTFDIGDNVRIESLGFEGTLQFLGAIDGKVGVWAGVELSGGFFGKGKNDGSVNGKQYFVCPPNCGVFVSTAKLSMPTVNRSSFHRPPSAASSRSGRQTPSITSRPSLSAGRPSSSSLGSFPSSGRITPSHTLTSATTATTPTRNHPRYDTNSRISRNASSVGQQSLSDNSSRPAVPGHDADRISPQESKLGPALLNGLGDGAPTTTPRYGRTPLAIRPRVPSAVAMPPPPSPIIDSLRRPFVSGERPSDDTDQCLPGIGRVALAFETGPSSPLLTGAPNIKPGLESTSVTSQFMHTSSPLHRNDTEESQSCATIRLLESSNVTGFEGTNQMLLNEISHVREKLRQSEATLAERNYAEHAFRQTLQDLNKEHADNEQRVRTLEGQLSETVASRDLLIETLHDKEAQENGRESVLKGKTARISELEVEVKRLAAQSDVEKRELIAQIEELRRAGQETIALYEERLNDAECKRFELEDRIVNMETRQSHYSETYAPESGPQNDSATQIDNESLRDHVLHLQQKIAALEDKLEDVQATAENEGTVLRDKAKRFKEKEEAMRRELSQGRKEADQAIKSEAAVRLRLQEIEEALRENTMALEDARAEVEGLRSELVNATSIVDESKSYRTDAHGTRSALNKARHFVDDRESGNANSSSSSHHAMRALESRNAELEKLAEVFQLELTQERQIAIDLRQSLADRNREFNTLMSRLCNDTPGTTAQRSSRTSSSTSQSYLSRNEETSTRQEITGLKLIVHELQQENSEATHRAKMFEAENELLRSETGRLREELKILEDGFEQSILREDLATAGTTGRLTNPVDANLLDIPLVDQNAKFEAELDQLRQRLADADMKHARLQFESSKEINELESLVESKIYREDELEAELERMKAVITQLQKHSSKEDIFTQKNAKQPSNGTICEICEQPGHDIFTCSLLKEDPKDSSIGLPNSHRPRNGDSAIMFCEDCDSHGHIASDCPHSLDVF